ncbi:hypothetical protein LP420_09485 [Massilia sp. B-10]|nr:hypothetical protein LP420_09485 [Massilia sp. B-10]
MSLQQPSRATAPALPFTILFSLVLTACGGGGASPAPEVLAAAPAPAPRPHQRPRLPPRRLTILAQPNPDGAALTFTAIKHHRQGQSLLQGLRQRPQLRHLPR